MKLRNLLPHLLLISGSVLAGDKAGNGGGGHVCPSSVELYDFYEGRHPDLHNLKIWDLQEPTLTTNDYVQLGLNKLEGTHPGIVPGIRNIITEIQAIPYEKLVRPIKIPRIPDADIPFVDEECEYEQIANWNERFDALFFRKKLFEALNPMNQAGLFIHEALYKAGRELNGLENSNHVRKLVAKIFSDNDVTTEDVRNVFGNNVVVAPKSGTCEVRFHFSSSKYNVCKLSAQESELFLGKIKHSSTSQSYSVNCEELHSAGTVELNYNSTYESACDVSMEINGEFYQMKEVPLEFKAIYEFSKF